MLKVRAAKPDASNVRNEAKIERTMTTILDWLNTIKRWLLPIGALFTLVGYFGPWINHEAAGLVVTGLDLGEYIKFLPAIVNGEIELWREGFYLPLLCVSLTLSLNAFRHEYDYRWPIRLLLLAVAVIAALNMLPPAWTPQRLITPEFRFQAMAIGICLLCVGFSPFLALIPAKLAGTFISVLALLAIWFSVRGFLTVLNDISLVYNQAQSPSWGPWAMTGGLIMIAVTGFLPWHFTGNGNRS